MAPSEVTRAYDALLSSTLDNYKDTLVDNIFASAVFLSAIKEAGGFETRNGGDKIKQPLMYGKTPVRSYSGYGVLNTQPTEGITDAFYEWKQISTPIAISGIEEMKNRGEARLYPLLKAKIEQAEMSLSEEVNLQLLGKTVSSSKFISGNDSQDLTPLAQLIPKDPTAAVTVGNIAQGTYEWWRSRSIDGSVNGLSSKDSGALKGWDLNTWVELNAALRSLFNYCSRGAGGSPNMVLTDPTGFETFEAGLEAKVRYAGPSKGSLAFDNIMFKAGVPMYWDEHVPDLENGVAHDSGSYSKSVFFMLNMKFIKFIVDQETNFTATPFVKPENQDAKVAHIMMYGNLVCNQRRKQGCLYGVSQAIVA